MDQRFRTRASAYAVATDDDRLLLTLLSEASPTFLPGLWHLPGGGIDPGEQPEEALAREVHEETGLTLRSARLLTARTYTAHRHGVHWQVVGLFYRVALEPGTPRVTVPDDSTAAARWHALDSLTPAALSPAAADALGLLRGTDGAPR